MSSMVLGDQMRNTLSTALKYLAIGAYSANSTFLITLLSFTFTCVPPIEGASDSVLSLTSATYSVKAALIFSFMVFRLSIV